MRIGIDIDGVLTNIGQFVIDYASKYCVENNIEYTVGEIDYDYCKTLNISREVEENFWNEYLEHYAVDEKARTFAAEVIEKLKNDGHEIYIITARLSISKDDDSKSKMKEVVKKWLSENKIVYDELIFSKAEKERKLQEIIENKIDLMIEDNPSNIEELSNIIPIICYDAEYNRTCTSDKVTRCYSWYDIYRNIKQK